MFCSQADLGCATPFKSTSLYNTTGNSRFHGKYSGKKFQYMAGIMCSFNMPVYPPQLLNPFLLLTKGGKYPGHSFLKPEKIPVFGKKTG